MATAPDTTFQFLYGTAWKEEATERLVYRALEAGFRGIDTANQRKHYVEADVGKAVQRALANGLVTRDTVFLQTKFTHRRGQDERLPYDEHAPVATQVRQSVASSLKHLGVTRLDSYVLHGPSQRTGLATGDVEAWRAMETLHGEGVLGQLGLSNVGLDQVQAVCGLAKVAPAVVQNRCYARTGWDREVRAFCRANGIRYQGFSLLTANDAELRKPALQALVKRRGITQAQAVFAFALAVGMQPLTGTTDPAHMREDLGARAVLLDPAEIALIETLAG